MGVARIEVEVVCRHQRVVAPEQVVGEYLRVSCHSRLDRPNDSEMEAAAVALLADYPQ
jgi:hypothetical protein